MPNILIPDDLDPKSVEQIRALGFSVETKFYPPEELVQQITPYDAIVVRSNTKVTKTVIDAGINLKLIVRGGVGVDNIDVAYAESKKIPVMNTPAASSDSVAELALGMMFAIARNITSASVDLKSGKWDKKKYSSGFEMTDKVLGIIGLGRIGLKLAQKAASLGMRDITTHDKFADSLRGKGIPIVSMDELLEKSDFISLHVPFDPATGPVIGKNEFAKMKDGAVLINCARGGVVDEEALLEALNNGKLRGAGLDVFENEPNPRRDLIEHPKVICTPHIGAATVEAQARVGGEVMNILKEFFGK